MFAATPAVLASCARGGDHFGRIEPPRGQRLVFQIGAEPETLDPVKSEDGSEEFILPSLFEGVLTLHPNTDERMRKLENCERLLLRQMPYVHGFDPHRLGLVPFKHVWIDTGWKS